MNRDYSQPWNKGRTVGPRQALEQKEISQIYAFLSEQNMLHDLCLFTVAIDTMLRASDLLKLRVSDLVHENGEVKTTFPLKQKKTANGVFPVLTPNTKKAVLAWIKESDKQMTDYLFTREKSSHEQPITIGFYRTLIKTWVDKIGLPPEYYSAHSLRRSKAIFMYRNGVTVELIGRLLGHKSPVSTIRYLGIDEEQAKEAALKYDILKKLR